MENYYQTIKTWNEEHLHLRVNTIYKQSVNFLLTAVESLLGIFLGVLCGFFVDLITPQVKSDEKIGVTVGWLILAVSLSVLCILIVFQVFSSMIGIFNKQTTRGSTSSIFFMFGFFFAQTQLQERVDLLYRKFIK